TPAMPSAAITATAARLGRMICFIYVFLWSKGMRVERASWLLHEVAHSACSHTEWQRVRVRQPTHDRVHSVARPSSRTWDRAASAAASRTRRDVARSADP